MENMCINCGFYKTPPLFWGGSTEPLFCDCPKERSYSEEEVINLLYIRSMCQEHYESDAEVREWFNKFKNK